MRHRNKKGRLGRRTAWRKATLKSMAGDLFTYQRIETTQAKAKALKVFAEPLVTLARKNPDSVAARRQAFSKLCDRKVVKALFDEIAPLFKDVDGGYTRTILTGTRKGDGAQLAMIELTRKTISEDDLLGITKEKKLAAKKKKKAEARKAKEEEAVQKGHVAPEVDIEEKEERVVEDRKKEKAHTEQKKVESKKTKGGFFRRFQRKKLGPKGPK